LTDVICAGSKFKLDSPCGEELPSSGFDAGEDTYQRPPASTGQLSVKVDVSSDRLQLLTPFDKWDERDIENMTVLIKVTRRPSLTLMFISLILVVYPVHSVDPPVTFYHATQLC